MSSPLEEIKSYLEHHDYVLGMRRMLDYSLDTNEPALIREAIELSKAFGVREK